MSQLDAVKAVRDEAEEVCLYMEGQLEGIVVEANGELVKVRVKHHGECSHCGACAGDMALLLDARCPGGASVGDRVLVDVPATEGLKSAFVIYVLPLLGAAAGWGAGLFIAWLMKSETQWPSIALCVAGVVCSLLYLGRYDKLVAARTGLPNAVRCNASEVTTKRD